MDKYNAIQCNSKQKFFHLNVHTTKLWMWPKNLGPDTGIPSKGRGDCKDQTGLREACFFPYGIIASGGTQEACVMSQTNGKGSR